MILDRARKFLSSTFSQPLGTRTGEGGYYIDLRVKATSPDWPAVWPYAPGEQSWIALAQYGLGAHEHYVHGGGERWLQAAKGVGDMLCESQEEDGTWLQLFDLPHTYHLKAPWISAMAQGEAASLLVRLHAAGGDDRYAEAARRALPSMPMAVLPDGSELPQEYPTEPASHVLNGAIFAIWGLLDGGERDRFEDAVAALVRNLHRWDTGAWSLYDLYPHPTPNWASLAYHELHAAQLRATASLRPHPVLTKAADRFESYMQSPAKRARAFAHKAAFRVRVPR
jgi:hypothetical protein